MFSCFVFLQEFSQCKFLILGKMYLYIQIREEFTYIFFNASTWLKFPTFGTSHFQGHIPQPSAYCFPSTILDSEHTSAQVSKGFTKRGELVKIFFSHFDATDFQQGTESNEVCQRLSLEKQKKNVYC